MNATQENQKEKEVGILKTKSLRIHFEGGGGGGDMGGDDAENGRLVASTTTKSSGIGELETSKSTSSIGTLQLLVNANEEEVAAVVAPVINDGELRRTRQKELQARTPKARQEQSETTKKEQTTVGDDVGTTELVPGVNSKPTLQLHISLHSANDNSTAMSDNCISADQDEEQGNAPFAPNFAPKALPPNASALKRMRQRACGRIGYCIIMVATTIIIVASVLGATQYEAPPDPTLYPTISPSSSATPVMGLDSPSTHPTAAPTRSLDPLLDDLPAYTLASLKNSSTPQSKAMLWLQNHNNVTNLPEWRKKQLFALATFYFAYEGPNWAEPIRDGWMGYNVDECFWHSSYFGLLFEDWRQMKQITHDMKPCNANGEIQSLLLGGLGHAGHSPHIPSEISLLTSLSILALPSNNVTLLVDLLPIETLQQMPNLSILNLRKNNLSGTIPSEIGMLSNLHSLSLSSNALSGTIPTEIGMLQQIEVLNLHNNKLTGVIPTELGMMTNMIDLAIHSSPLTGIIPTELGDCTTLVQLSVFNTSLSGSIPQEVGLLVKNHNLARLLLHRNSKMTGTVPKALCFLDRPSCSTAETFFDYDVNEYASECKLEFGCTPLLCGCGCICSL